ncbi:hypothetical protein B0T11DRAFT_51838 [Plectosphaerella cucumerina]|uniref:Uncharacterized protein n=1 Tax=Plectosphaerella cucumerina TaxID=40658 RepID=A0A8K0TGR4_9PEZI|nr:hypothetical protein B0T11DRAFT_51838 [Plectosphaerella cucumerina]
MTNPLRSGSVADLSDGSTAVSRADKNAARIGANTEGEFYICNARVRDFPCETGITRYVRLGHLSGTRSPGHMLVIPCRGFSLVLEFIYHRYSRNDAVGHLALPQARFVQSPRRLEIEAWHPSSCFAAGTWRQPRAGLTSHLTVTTGSRLDIGFSRLVRPSTKTFSSIIASDLRETQRACPAAGRSTISSASPAPLSHDRLAWTSGKPRLKPLQHKTHRALPRSRPLPDTAISVLPTVDGRASPQRHQTPRKSIPVTRSETDWAPTSDATSPGPKSSRTGRRSPSVVSRDTACRTRRRCVGPADATLRYKWQTVPGGMNVTGCTPPNPGCQPRF